MHARAKLPSATQAEREKARASATAIRRAIADPATAGERGVVHIDLSRPRRGLWLTTWKGLPGLLFDAGRNSYMHTLLPGWEYTVREMRTEMIEDLERLAETGERPTTVTRV